MIFGAWNVRTLLEWHASSRPERRTALIVRELGKNISALSETRLAEEGSIAESKGGYTFLWRVCLLVDCLTSRQHVSVSQGRICSDNVTCCHTEIEAADQTFHLTQSQYTDTGPTSPSADPITPGAWQGSHWSANV